MYDGLFLSLMLLPAAAGMLAGFVQSKWSKNISVMLCCMSAFAGMFAYPLCAYGGDISFTLPFHSAWGSYSVLIDGLSSAIISVSSAVFLAVLLHMSRSASAPADSRYSAMVCLLFISCMLAMCADTVLLLIVAWECATLSAFLMSYGTNAAAAWRFFVIAHIGGLMVICAFLIMMSCAGGQTLSLWSDLGSSIGIPLSCGAAALLFMGFGTKLGLVPFHAWMPDLYASAPTHTTALTSSVSTSAAVLILFKCVFGYIGASDGMYILAVILMAVSSFTVVWSAMESLVQTEPKRILAYSSMGNMALVVLCLSLGMLFSSSGPSGLMIAVLVAGLFHTMNHAVFKPLMLMAVGSAEDCTGETMMEKMGGLAKLMPVFSVIALIAVLSMAAVPPFNGFASEWLMIRSMMSGGGIRLTEILLPLGIAVLGIGGMMSAVSYVRLYGFIFLGRPRSANAANASGIDARTLFPMAVLAVLCVAMGIFCVQIMGALSDGITGATSIPSDALFIDRISRSLNVPMLAGILALVVAAVYILNRKFRKRTAVSPTWDCGTPLDENMQYSPLGFSQPLVKVFHPFYKDTVEAPEDGASGGKVRYSVRFRDPFVKHLYIPLGKLVARAAKLAGRTQNGNIQTYFGYILAVLVILLVAVRFL